MKKTISLLIMLSSVVIAFGQVSKTKETYEQIWLGYFNQTRLSDKWGFWVDTHLRTKDDFTDSLSQFIIRPGITYYLADKTKLTLGYAYVNHFPADSHPETSQPEHRIWQQLQWHNNYERIKLMQWVRLEERYRRKIKDADELADGYNFNFRARFNIMMQVALGKKKFEKGSLAWVVNDELMVNFGDQIVYNYFDQNRFFTGFHYYVTKHNFLQFGYMNVFQQLSSGNKYRVLHAARVFFIQNLDLRKKHG
ncbi:MAG TPA: DUF2490 domain-containing protein [Chitinophagaceae bacterium]|nr:DUF2490 domain-containing protein [Chitinophagaceae bacterium]